ncbi:putative MHC class II antigen protein, partial [Naja naja]
WAAWKEAGKEKRKRETEAFSALKPQKEKEALEPKCFVCCRNFGFSSESQIWGFEAHFLYQGKLECLFLNGTQRVRFLERHFYDRQEFARFDSDLGKFVAVTEFGKVDRTIGTEMSSGCRAGKPLWIISADTTTRLTATRRPRGRSERSGVEVSPGGEALLPWEWEAGTPFPFLAFTGDSPPG